MFWRGGKREIHGMADLLSIQTILEQVFVPPFSFLFIVGTMQFSDSLVYNNSDPNGTYQGRWVWDGAQQQAMVIQPVPQRLRGSYKL